MVLSNKITVKVLTIVSLLLTIILFVLFFIPILWGYALPAILLVVFYKKNTLTILGFRTIPLLKIFIISFCWMWTCAVLPQVLTGNEINWEIAVFEFSFVFIITIPFDVRDCESDKGNLITIPHFIGKNNAYLLSGFLLILLLAFSCYIEYYLIGVYIVLTFILLFLSKKIKKRILLLVGIRWFVGGFSNICTMKKKRSNILIIYTGGTIGMIMDPAKKALKPFDFNQITEKFPN